MTATKTTRGKKNRVRVRTYRHGLGDCHLVSFAKPDGSQFHLLIDCGVVSRTQNPGPLMTAVAKDIAEQTGKTLDVVVATHQHTDHLSGFKQADAVFRVGNIEMKRLWLAWTEDPRNPLGKKIQQELVRKLAAVRAAAAKLTALDRATADRVRSVLDFFGPAASDSSSTQAILNSLQKRTDVEISYFSPGDVFALPEVPNVRVYVLGPPTDPAQLKITNPRKSKREGYEIAAGATGFIDALEPNEERNPDLSYPFEKWYRHDVARMKQAKFFEQHYFGPDENGISQKWRQIDTAWLETAEEVALALNDFTNNTSLALVFEFIDSGEVLLFPGDAQIGSWLTWDNLIWNVTDPNGAKHEVRIADLLPRVVFYKGSHHASHNGTLTGYIAKDGLGLEQMTHPDLVCVVPVDREMSKKMGWDRTLPWEPLLKRLEEKTRGRLVLTDRKEKPPDAKKLETLSATERKRFAKQVVVTDNWVDYTL